MADIRSYRDLLVWQKAMDLVVRSYQLTDLLPASERFGLISQIQRTASNVPSSIANGHGIATTGQFLHYLAAAHGSLMMLETQIQITQRLKLLTDEVVQAALLETSEVGRLLNGLMRSLRN
jgi:four helix bundle protein